MTLSVRAAVAPAIKPLAEATRLEIGAEFSWEDFGMHIMQDMTIRSPWHLFLPLLLGLVTTPANAADEHTGHPVLGTVHFPVTCTPEAQQAFDHAIKLQHSFWYKAAQDAFADVL
jgi:hypothetical protein